MLRDPTLAPEIERLAHMIAGEEADAARPPTEAASEAQAVRRPLGGISIDAPELEVN